MRIVNFVNQLLEKIRVKWIKKQRKKINQLTSFNQNDTIWRKNSHALITQTDYKQSYIQKEITSFQSKQELWKFDEKTKSNYTHTRGSSSASFILRFLEIFQKLS